MIELETIISFNDVKDNVLREAGDRFKADEERARYLVDERKLCVVVKIDKETTGKNDITSVINSSEEETKTRAEKIKLEGLTNKEKPTKKKNLKGLLKKKVTKK